MMDWQQLRNNFSTATVESGNSINQAMLDFCQHIKLWLIPSNEGINWEYLRVEFWSDSGRMIAFPSSSSRPGRIEKAGCQVVFMELLSEYGRLADSRAEDDVFVAALHRKEKQWTEWFLEACRKVGLSDIRIIFWGGGGEFPIWDEQL